MPPKKKNKTHHRVTERPPGGLVQLHDRINQEKAQRAQAQTDEERGHHNKRIRALEGMVQARVEANQRAKQTARTRKAAARWQRMSGPR
jgi:hypothetical protein